MSPPNQKWDFLQYGDEAVERPIDSVLDDSAVAEPMKKDKRKKRKQSAGKLVLITANGYTGYDSVQDEINALQGKFWFPHTKDFNQTAADTRNKIHFGASNADEFFGALQNVRGKISRIVFIGHGFPGGLGLSGEPLNFFGKTLESTDIDHWQADINESIKPKLMENAKIDLVACNLAIDKAFMSDLANALGICVRAFSEAVVWCTTFDKDKKKITGRGRIGPKSAVKGKSCSDKAWSKGVNNFVPPEEVCPKNK